jgi:arsenite-transporting ATPase
VGEDELPAFPGIDAIGALLVAERARATGRFDLLIFDGPAPFPLVRALSLPDALRWLLRLIFGIDRGPGRSRTSVETAMIPASLIAPTAVAPFRICGSSWKTQRARVDASTGARVRLVLKPEELHLSEYREILTGLGFYGVAADEIQVNGAPESIDDATRHEFSPAAFTGRPLLRQIKLETTPATRDDWALRGASMYRDKNIFDDHAPPDETAPSDREMRLHMPFLNAKALDIAVASEEVVVRIEQWRRHILLPGMVDGGKLRAKVEGETLRLWVE